MPRTKKTAVSRETSSASTPKRTAGTELKEQEPSPEVDEILASYGLTPGGLVTGWQCYDLIMYLINSGLIGKRLNDLDERLTIVEDKLKSIMPTTEGYSLTQWIDDYKKWRDQIVGFALDDAIAGLKSET